MVHFGVLSYQGAGHLNPLMALSRQLMARGHRVTFFLNAEAEERIRASGLDFVPIGAGEKSVAQRGKPSGSIAAIRYRLRRTIGEMEMFLRETPPLLERARVDALILDELALAGPTVAQMLRLPYIIISTSVPHCFGWSVPRCFTPTRPLLGRVQSALLELSALNLRGPVRRSLDRIRRNTGLGPVRNLQKEFPALAHLTQLPQCLDYPRAAHPPAFYYAGPFIDETARPPIPFPWERLDARPLVYASLGTTRKCDPVLFRWIAEACDGLGVQLVLSLGGRRDPDIFRNLPGDPLVINVAPQLQLLKRAAAVITHAGSNTAFEALTYGKPMVAIPKAFDQPAIAARLAWRHTAIVLPSGKLSVKHLRAALVQILEDPSYRLAAEEMKDVLQSLRGVERAADCIEAALDQYATSLNSTAYMFEKNPLFA